MITLWIVAGIVGILTFVLSILPDSTFLPIPSQAWDAVDAVGNVIGWGSGLAGADIQEAFLNTISLIIGINIAVFLWSILRRWKPPVVGKFL